MSLVNLSKRRMTTMVKRMTKSKLNLKTKKVMTKYLTLERSKWTSSKFVADKFYVALLLRKLKKKHMKEILFP